MSIFQVFFKIKFKNIKQSKKEEFYMQRTINNSLFEYNLNRLTEMYPRSLILTPKQVAEVLNCSEKSVYNKISRVNNPLPHGKDGGKVVISVPKLAEWLTRLEV